MDAIKKSEIIKLLKRHNMQVTSSRLAICEYVLAPFKHTTAHEVRWYLNKTFPNVSLATIYNTLKSLVNIGVLREINVPSLKTVIYDSTLLKHYHVYDENKNQVFDIDVDRVKIDLTGLDWVEFSDIDLVLKGIVK